MHKFPGKIEHNDAANRLGCYSNGGPEVRTEGSLGNYLHLLTSLARPGTCLGSVHSTEAHGHNYSFVCV